MHACIAYKNLRKVCFMFTDIEFRYLKFGNPSKFKMLGVTISL